MKFANIALALALGALALACHKDEPKESITETTSATQTKPSLSDGDRAFITKITQGGMLEVALGEHVTRKAAAADVRDFGKQMVIDHSTADEELKNIAANKGVNVPVQLDSDHRATYDKLAKLKGKKLDKEYSDDMARDHEEDVKELKEASQNLEDPDLRAWASKTVPVLEGHLQKAKALKKNHD